MRPKYGRSIAHRNRDRHGQKTQKKTEIQFSGNGAENYFRFLFSLHIRMKNIINIDK